MKAASGGRSAASGAAVETAFGLKEFIQGLAVGILLGVLIAIVILQ